MYYVTHRWLGGTLTNFVTIRRARSSASSEPSSASWRGRSSADQEGAGPPRARAREAGEEPRRHPPRWSAARRALRGRPEEGGHRGRRGEQARHPGDRRRRHQLRPGAGRLRDPRQRRRHPLDPALHLAHRRRLPRGRRHPRQGDCHCQEPKGRAGRGGRERPPRRRHAEAAPDEARLRGPRGIPAAEGPRPKRPPRAQWPFFDGGGPSWGSIRPPVLRIRNPITGSRPREPPVRSRRTDERHSRRWSRSSASAPAPG
jgi:hypothetical protein